MTTAPEAETFLQRMKRLKAEQEALERGTDPWSDAPVTGDVEAGHPRAQRWVEAKVAAQLAEVASRAEGDRNDHLNHVAYSIGRLAPKWIDPKVVGPQLVDAAQTSGLPYDEALATVRSGMRAGMDEPRDPPIETGVDPFADEPAPVVEGEAARPPTLHEQMVARHLADIRAREEARRAYDLERTTATFREPPTLLTLADELRLPDEPVQYAIEELLPAGANAVLTAQYKTGKTTVIGDLARSFADNEPFLDRFAIHPAGGRIAIWNYELSPGQYRRWLRDLAIQHPERVAVLHLRGFRIDFRTPYGQDWAVRWLVEREVTFWVPDPLARASVGVEENGNTEMGEWLDILDIIKERAGVRDLVMPNHTGREKFEPGDERGRGATRVDDWTDVRWILTKDKESVRYFRATGRDVEFGETKLSYDETTRRLHCGGGDRRWEKDKQDDAAVLAYITRNPGTKSTEIPAGLAMNKGDADRARVRLLGSRAIVEVAGKGTAKHFFPRGAVPFDLEVTDE